MSFPFKMLTGVTAIWYGMQASGTTPERYEMTMHDDDDSDIIEGQIGSKTPAPRYTGPRGQREPPHTFNDDCP